jgi:hypothetical protein
MDKPRHPNVIRTWKLYNSLRGLPPDKSQVQRQPPARGVPPVQKPRRRSRVEKPQQPE